MAPGASLIALRVLGADGTGTVDGVINALQWVLDHAKAQKHPRREPVVRHEAVRLAAGRRPAGDDARPGSRRSAGDCDQGAGRCRHLRRRCGRQRRPGRLRHAAPVGRASHAPCHRPVRCLGRHHRAGHVPVGVHGRREQLEGQLHPRRRCPREVQLARSGVPAANREARHPRRRSRHRVDRRSRAARSISRARPQIRRG